MASVRDRALYPLYAMTDTWATDNIFVWNQSVEIAPPVNTTYMIVYGSLSGMPSGQMVITATPNLTITPQNKAPWANDTDSMNRDNYIHAMLPLDSTQNYTITLTSLVYPDDDTADDGFLLSKVSFYTIPQDKLKDIKGSLIQSVTDSSGQPSTTTDEGTVPSVQTNQAAQDNANATTSRIWKGVLAALIVRPLASG